MDRYCRSCSELAHRCRMNHRWRVWGDRTLSSAATRPLRMILSTVPSQTSCPSHRRREAEGPRCRRTFDLDTTKKIVKKLLKPSSSIYLMSRTVRARRSRPQQRCASSVQRAPKLRTNLIQLRAHLQVFVGRVELQSTL